MLRDSDTEADFRYSILSRQDARILPVLLRVSVILNRKFWTMVQAAKAHDAFVFDPNRLFLFDLDSENGTISCA